MEDRKGIFRSMTIGPLRRRGLGRNQTEVVDELCAEKPANTRSSGDSAASYPTVVNPL